MASQLGFYHNADICIGCKACVIACKDKNDLTVGHKFRRVFDYGGGSWTVENGACKPVDQFIYSLSTSCNHCAQPACVANCPVGAMQKREEDGIVFVDQERCIACGTCEKVCPYGQPKVNKDLGYSQKCDFCKSLLANGENPACVDACVTRALQFGPLDDLLAEYGNVQWIPPLTKDTGTYPSVVFTPSRLNPDNALEGAIINPLEEIL